MLYRTHVSNPPTLPEHTFATTKVGCINETSTKNLNCSHWLDSRTKADDSDNVSKQLYLNFQTLKNYNRRRWSRPSLFSHESVQCPSSNNMSVTTVLFDIFSVQWHVRRWEVSATTKVGQRLVSQLRLANTYLIKSPDMNTDFEQDTSSCQEEYVWHV